MRTLNCIIVGSDNCGNDGVGGGCSGGYDDEDDDNGERALWDKNDYDFYVIPFGASSGYKPPQNEQMSLFPHIFLCHFSV
jgi:hypothetical protein